VYRHDTDVGNISVNENSSSSLVRRFLQVFLSQFTS
jgi:hypothetical protein